jgi:WW domain-containing oxidoreductase
MAKSGFGKRSTAEEVTDGVDLTGKVALVTGVNSGIGAETLRVLALRGAHVIGTARTLAKAEEGCAQAPGRSTPLECELTDLDSVRACVRAIREQFPRLDIIVANAGVMALPKLQQVRGIEMQFATNHLGHFLLVTSLLEQLNDAARIVIVSSDAHRMAPKPGIDFANLSGEQGYGPMRAYGQSKIANILFAGSLSKRLAGRATVNSLHPGVIGTNLGRHMNPAVARVMGLFMRALAKTVPQGAATSCLLAASPAVAGVTGRYFADCREAKATATANDDALAERLWQVSEELVA